jgi:phage terminase small subunit
MATGRKRLDPEQTLTDRQARFVEEYQIDLNATKAAIRAGYSPKGATVRGSELLANRNVRATIDAMRAARSERMELTVASITSDLLRLANRAKAMATPSSLSVARQSLMDVAKLNGLVVETSVTIVRSTEERAARLAELRSERERLTRTH